MENSNKIENGSLVLNRSILKPGDIVLSSEPSLTSKIIRLSTLSNYSHAMLYVGNSLIHAEGKGIFSINPQRLLYTLDNNICVLRYKKGLTDEQEKLIIEYSRNQVGKLYGVFDAVTSIFKKFNNNDNKQFCSRLIAIAYKNAGIALCSHYYNCTPQDLYSSKLLIKVDNILTNASRDDIITSNKLDIISINSRDFYYWLNEVRKIASKNNFLIRNENDVIDYISKYPLDCEEICFYLFKSGYLNDYKLDIHNNPHRFSTKRILKKWYKNENIKFGVFQDMLLELSVIQRFIHQELAYLSCPKSKLSLIFVKFYNDLIKFSFLKLENMKNFFEIIKEKEAICFYKDILNTIYFSNIDDLLIIGNRIGSLLTDNSLLEKIFKDNLNRL